MYVHRAYKLCTVSADYTRVNVYVHSVYKPRTVSTNYAQCPQTIRIRVHVHICKRRGGRCDLPPFRKAGEGLQVNHQKAK